MNNTELIKALKDAELYLGYVAPRCYASIEAGKAIRATADALEKTVPREWWLKMRAYITDLAENNKGVPRSKPYYDYAEFLLKLMDTIEADSNPASKLVVPKFKQITADRLADMCKGVVLDEDGHAATDVIEWEDKQ